MNPYKEIARRHLTLQDLEDLIKEKMKLQPKKITETEKRRLALRESLERRKKGNKKNV